MQHSLQLPLSPYGENLWLHIVIRIGAKIECFLLLICPTLKKFIRICQKLLRVISIISKIVLSHSNNKRAVREAATICPRPLQIDLWPFDLETGVRVTCNMAYLCANFSLPRSLCSRLRPNVCDRQASDVHHCLIPLPRGGGIIIIIIKLISIAPCHKIQRRISKFLYPHCDLEHHQI